MADHPCPGGQEAGEPAGGRGAAPSQLLMPEGGPAAHPPISPEAPLGLESANTESS